jgi:acyl-CoA reductase-like NAD-dependent aldehyde dehydrogenase
MGVASTQHLNFINGEFVSSTSGKWLQKRLLSDQAIGPEIKPEIKREVADSDLMDVVRAVQAANKALPNWIKTTPEQRAQTLLKIADLIEKQAGAFAKVIFEDLGTNEAETLRSSIPVAIEHFRAHARAIDPSVMEKQSPPLGLVAAIFPASDPLVCMASRIAPALAYANVMIAKASRFTPATGALFSQVVKEAEIPAGVFNLLQGRGDEVGEAIVRHPGIQAISFMGSTETGRKVALSAAESFKKVHYSLGAKNPVLVFANTDLTTTIPQVARLCLGSHPSLAYKGSRLFIQESIFKPAVELLKTEIEKSPTMPLAKPEHVTRYNEAIRLALKENGRPIVGGGEMSESNHWVMPALFADLTNCSTLQQDEIAGPLVLASSFKYQHEALKHANVSPYGRLGFVFENDPEKALRVAEKLEAGSVFTNNSNVRFDALEEIPLLKNSGFSPEGGAALARFFSRGAKIFNVHT